MSSSHTTISVSFVLRLLCAALFTITLLPLASAQVSGAIDRTLTGQNDILDRVKPVPKQGKIDITVVDEQPVAPEGQAEDATFYLRSLTVEGTKTFPPEDLTPAWKDKLDSTISLADLNSIADEIEAIYRQAGYFSQAVIPDQNFSSGNVNIDLYESSFDEITVESDIPDIKSRLAPYIDRLMALHPIPVAEVERILLLMSDLGGLTIEGVATRPEEPGAGGSMHLKVTRTPVTTQIELDNFGSTEKGRLELTAAVDLNDQLGLFETTSFTSVTVPNDPEELRLIQLSQDYPIGSNGLHAGYTIAYVASRPGGKWEGLDHQEQTVSGTLFARYPFIRRITHSLFGSAELNFENHDLREAGMHTTRERFRWATASLDYNQTLEQGLFKLKGMIGVGLSGMGSTASNDPLSSRPGIPDHYRFSQLSAVFQHALWEGGRLTVRGLLQYAPNPLPPPVQLGFGGPSYGRAFDSAIAKGDSGGAITFELTQQFKASIPQVTETTAFAFIDYGHVRNHDVSVDYLRQTLGSVGAGLRANFGQYIQGQVFVTTPWKQNRNLNNSGTRVLFNITASFQVAHVRDIFATY